MNIIANSSPKAGTHLLVRLLELIDLKEHNKPLNGSMIRITQKNPYKKFLVSRKKVYGDFKTESFKIDLDDMKNRIKKNFLDQYMRDIKKNSFISAHVPYSKELDRYFEEWNFKMLYIIRDPRDMILSYYNHQNKDKKYNFYSFFKDKTFEESYKYILDGIDRNSYKLAPLKLRIENSLGWLKSKNTFVIKFEDLIGVYGGGSQDIQIKTIRDLLNFMELEKDKNEIEKIANNVFYKNAETFNKGKIYRWKDEMCEKTKKDITNHLSVIIKELEYE